MFYFFQRGTEFLQCEIRGDDASGYEIVITEPKRPERRESFPTSDEAYKRWVELQDTLVSAGWWGPARPGLALSLAGAPTPRSARQAHSLPLVRAVYETASIRTSSPGALTRFRLR